MRLLLDTHALLWALEAPERLPPWIRAVIEDTANEVFVSAASAWEIAIKQSLSRLAVPRVDLASALRGAGLVELPITLAHAERVRSLPPLHRDPFDRMLVAQAQVEGLSFVSRDAVIRQYQVTVLWDPELHSPRTVYRTPRERARPRRSSRRAPRQ